MKKTENMKEYHKNWYDNHKDDSNFIDKRKRQFTEWYDKNKEKRRQYRKTYTLKNKDAINAKRRAASKIRLKTNPQYKLKLYISNSINRQLSKSNSSKLGLSCLDYLPFSIQELKAHLEKQFEPWMTWNNRGKYNIKNWNDNDQLTWTWQIDHIIPHSNFKYTSMSDIDFIACWSLDNLRPISSKENIAKGDK